MKKYKIGIYEKAFPEELQLAEMLKLAQFKGYDYFEISIDRTEKRIQRLFSEEFVKELKDAINRTKIPVLSICLSALGTYALGHEDKKVRQRGLDIAKASITFADKIGARIIQLPACDVPKGSESHIDTMCKYFEGLKTVVEEAAAHGLFIGLENMETESWGSVLNCMELINSIDSPFFQMYPDTGNITSAAKLLSEDPIIDFEQCRGRSIALHVKETKPDRYGGLFYGEGHVDFDAMIEAAWAQGIRLFVLEYWFTGNTEWKQDLLLARDIVDRVLRGK